jgi:YesN/AraC family two-component response regulator
VQASGAPSSRDSVAKKTHAEKNTRTSQKKPVQSSKTSQSTVTNKKQSPPPVIVKSKKTESRSAEFKIVATNILERIAENIPILLKIPMKKSGDIVRAVEKSSGKIIFLSISFVTIIGSILFFRHRIEKNRFMTTTRLSVMDKEVQRACRYIENNYDNVDLNVDFVCLVMVTGKAFLNALFKKELGLSVEDFITQVRVNRVKIILNNDPSTEVESLVLKTGFSGSEVLLKAFVKITGVDIEEFRRSLMTGQKVK